MPTLEFELAMQAMAADPAIRCESEHICQEFLATELDGLNAGDASVAFDPD
jgi:hypothetical protein